MMTDEDDVKLSSLIPSMKDLKQKSCSLKIKLFFHDFCVIVPYVYAVIGHTIASNVLNYKQKVLRSLSVGLYHKLTKQNYKKKITTYLLKKHLNVQKTKKTIFF